MPEFSLQSGPWTGLERLARPIREQVFIREQGVPEALEWDGLDADCLHVVAVDADHNPVGTARLCAHGHIGRMAVLPAWRGRGIGTAMLQCLVEDCLNRHEIPHLNAQVDARGFYEKQGFTAEGDVFMDAEIPHVHMKYSIPNHATR